MNNKFYQRRTIQRIPRTSAEAERFIWHALEHVQESYRVDKPYNHMMFILEIAIEALQYGIEPNYKQGIE